jgi:hypothetical protein
MAAINCCVTRLGYRRERLGFVPSNAIFGLVSVVFDAFSQGRQLKLLGGVVPLTAVRASSDAITLRQRWHEHGDFTGLQRKLAKFTMLFFAVSLLGGTAIAANWYVRPAAQGAATGEDWNNAWSISGIAWGNVKPGDTVWLAGGSYTSGITIGANGAPGSTINLLRATGSDIAATGAAGWQAAFDSQVQLPGSDGILDSQYSHIVVDGRTQYGILITIANTGGYGVECDPGGGAGLPVTDIAFHNVDILGPYCSISNPSPNQNEAVGFKIDPSDGSLSNVLIDHCRIRGCATGLHCLISNLTLQYSVLQDFWPAWGGSDIDHPDVMYCYPSPNMTWRYNTIINSQSDGVFFEFGGAANFYFYGNVYYNTTNSLMTFKAASGSVYGPVFIYNNTFEAPSASNYGWITTDQSSMTSGSQVYDNIFFNVSNDIEQSTTDYNAYNYTTLNGYPWPGANQGGYGTEPHSVTFTGNPFVLLPSYSGNNTTPQLGNFHLTASAAPTFAGGLALGADGFINMDMDGNPRGNGGAWYIGAYQYVGNGTPVAPMAPTNLHIVSSP